MHLPQNILRHPFFVGISCAGKPGLDQFNIPVTKIIPKDNQLVVRVENVKDVNHYMERLDEMITRKKEALIQYGVI